MLGFFLATFFIPFKGGGVLKIKFLFAGTVTKIEITFPGSKEVEKNQRSILTNLTMENYVEKLSLLVFAEEFQMKKDIRHFDMKVSRQF